MYQYEKVRGFASVTYFVQDVCGVEDVWSVLPHPHQTVVTQAFLELVLRGGGCGLGRALRDGGLLDAPVFTSHISKVRSSHACMCTWLQVGVAYRDVST